MSDQFPASPYSTQLGDGSAARHSRSPSTAGSPDRQLTNAETGSIVNRTAPSPCLAVRFACPVGFAAMRTGGRPRVGTCKCVRTVCEQRTSPTRARSFYLGFDFDSWVVGPPHRFVDLLDRVVDGYLCESFLDGCDRDGDGDGGGDGPQVVHRW